MLDTSTIWVVQWIDCAVKTISPRQSLLMLEWHYSHEPYRSEGFRHWTHIHCLIQSTTPSEAEYRAYYDVIKRLIQGEVCQVSS